MADVRSMLAFSVVSVTKFIEIVQIGKQLLITRGTLTTFSITNDVAKYFAIIPAMFASVYPGLGKLNVMALHSPTSAITSAIIVQRVDQHSVDPAGSAGSPLPPPRRRRRSCAATC